MQLFYTKRSPFARKVIVALKEKGLEKQVQLALVDLKDKPAALLATNPLGKIPALKLADGSGLVDSPVICDYVDSLDKTLRLIPKSGPKRFKVLHVEALADGMCEAAIAVFYQRDGGSPDQAVIDKNVAALHRAFESLQNEHIKTIRAKRITLAPIAVASALGYINFRLPELAWEKKYKKLARWYTTFSERPSMQSTVPTM
jgi:glutathione S-transferase